MSYYSSSSPKHSGTERPIKNPRRILGPTSSAGFPPNTWARGKRCHTIPTTTSPLLPQSRRNTTAHRRMFALLLTPTQRQGAHTTGYLKKKTTALLLRLAQRQQMTTPRTARNRKTTVLIMGTWTCCVKRAIKVKLLKISICPPLARRLRRLRVNSHRIQRPLARRPPFAAMFLGLLTIQRNKERSR